MTSAGRLSLTVSILLDEGGAFAARQPSPLHDQVASFFDDVAQLDPARFGDACRIVALPDFPRSVRIKVGPKVHWDAENCELAAEVDFALEAPCLAFSYALPDHRAVLSASFDIAYQGGLQDHLSLAAVQDALLLAADNAPDHAGVRLQSAADAAPLGVGDFLRAHLSGGRALTKLRWACVFEDPALFDALHRRDREFDADPAPTDGLVAALAALAHFHGTQTTIDYTRAQIDAWSRAWSACAQALLFMSGFSQGVIDFLRQDVSEVDDGTDPIYPANSDAGRRTHWLLYGNANAIVEVVRASRSAQSGRALVGNCPYLLLVHLLSMDNEALADAHAKEVAAMLASAETAAPKEGTDIDNPQQVIRLGNEMRKLRLKQMDIMSRIERHYHDNVFRYDTESAFFAAVNRVRGIERRRHQLATTTTQLTDTLDQIAKLVAEREQRVLNLSVSALAVLSLFSLLVDVPGKLREWKLLPVPWDDRAHHLSFVVYLLVLALLAFLLWRTVSLLLRLMLRLVDEAHGSERPATLWRQLVAALRRIRR